MDSSLDVWEPDKMLGVGGEVGGLFSQLLSLHLTFPPASSSLQKQKTKKPWSSQMLI